MKKILLVLCAFLLIGCKDKVIEPVEEPIVIEIDEECFHNTKLKKFNNSIPHIYKNYIEMDDDTYGNYVVEMYDSNYDPVWSYTWRDLIVSREDYDIVPLIYEDRMIINVQGVISVHDLLTGAFIWELETTQTDAKFAVEDDILYVLGYKENYVSGVSLETGELLLEIKDDSYLDVNAIAIEDDIIAYYETMNITRNAVSFDKTGTFKKRLAYQERSRVLESWSLAITSDETEAANNLIDEKKNTCWRETVKGYGEKEWVEITRTFPVIVNELRIMNGDQSLKKSYNENAKLKKVTLSVGDGKSFTYIFENFEYGKEDIIKFVKPIMADYILLTIIEAEPGEVFKNTCISEIGTK